MSSPEPMPSLSAPLPFESDLRTEMNRKPRRHTITRPDSAIALLSDMEDDGDDEQQQAFDRISSILNSLIQEANNAVHGLEHERVQLVSSSNTRRKPSKSTKVFTSSTIITQNHRNTTADFEIQPRPTKSRSFMHQRNPSSTACSASSSNSLFSLVSAASTSTTLLSRSPSPTLPNYKKQVFRHTAPRHRSCPTSSSCSRRSVTPRTKRMTTTVSDPIVESFKRLDSSMALVDSLSRDLATHKVKDNNKTNLLLLVPLLHIPLLTMIFDFCSSNTAVNTGKPTPSFVSSLILWVCVFAATHVMVDQVSVTPLKKPQILKTPCSTSIPGSFINNTTAEKKKPPPTTKRTWIPATVQQQQQQVMPKFSRRKSI